MIYAPVIIPTLNRYKHFKQCLESLERCFLSDKTTVYVGLDYPPSDKYVEGWKKIDAYLKEKETKNGFGNLIVFRRDHNLGLGINGNSANLHNFVRQHHDRYITSEDDNVFSPNFLEYINKGLELYIDDPRVFCICGYTQPYSFLFKDNNHFFHNTDMSAWGYGSWTSKTNVFINEARNSIFHRTFSLKNYLKVRKHGFNRLMQYISYVCRDENQPFPLVDCVISVYCILTNMYVVCPSMSKVRNIGWDLDGQSFQDKKVLERNKKFAERHMNQQIDTAEHFEFKGDPLIYLDYNNRLTAKVSEGRISWFVYMRAALSYARKYCWRRFKILITLRQHER